MSNFPETIQSKWLLHLLKDNFLLLAGTLSVYVSIFSARFSISRVLPGISAQWLVLSEVRTWAVISAIILVAAGWKSRMRMRPANMPQVWKCIGLIVLAQLALLSHAVFYRPFPQTAYFAWELTGIILISVTLGIAFRVWGVRFVNALMWVSLFFALLIAVWMLAAAFGVKKTDVESSPLATTFTFYRIQIFGGFSALVILFASHRILRGAALSLGTTLCFAAAYLSLSKAALLAGTGGALFLAAVYVTWFSKVRASVVLCISVAAVILFAFSSGGMFTARVAGGLLGAGYPMSTSGVSPPTREEVIALEGEDGNLALYQARLEAQKRQADVIACTAGKYPCTFKVTRWEQEIADTMLRHRVYIPDFSFRIRLLIEGAKGIARAPWAGNGFGAFNVVGTNLYTKEPESYSHPHNIVVELLYSVGVLGAALVFGIVFTLFWLVMQAKEGLQSGLPMLAAAVSVCIGSVFGGDYMDFRLLWIALLLCTMLCRPSAGMSHPTSPCDQTSS
jgi:hypothetical protein